MPNYYLWTIGCQMNRAESDKISGCLEQTGYLKADSAENADLIVLNSCVVRQSAENRVINKLHALKTLKKAHPELKIALTGCLVGADTSQLDKFPQIDYMFKPGETPPWLNESFRALPKAEPAAFITIMQGCDNFCSYCIVPYRRGRERSRPIAEVVCEVNELVRRGVKEVTLLGQNVDSYGHNLPGRQGLADLLKELNSIEGLLRIRFLTNHPKDMSPRLIEAIASLDKVCEQINLPVQSGDNEILKAMRRGYTAERYRELVAEIRRKVPEIAITTDVIVGFPGETEEQFENSYRLLSELRFDKVHVAAYSPRQGTLAARELEDNVPAAVKKERVARVEELEEKLAGEINALLKDKTVEILVEGKQKGKSLQQAQGKWYGRIRSDKLVFFNAEGDYRGQMVNIKIIRTSPWSLTGSLASEGGVV